MSSDRAPVVVRCEGIGKQFALAHSDLDHALHRRLERRLRRLFRRAEPGARPSTFWALRDVSFEVRKGEVFGIIGGNGAGKSCLLKILSRVTKPSEGVAEVGGAIGSILQLGVFMQPELTGRENIFHGATLLRISRDEIASNFDEIVRFSGLGEFLDQPVKHYSLGMQMRLAFSVVTQLNTPIILIDEALSVGDEQFRERCHQRIRQLCREGRSIILVSHELDLIEDLCQRVMVLERGRMIAVGPASQVVPAYRKAMHGDG